MLAARSKGGGREAARIPEPGQSHRAGDQATTGEMQGRQVHWGLVIEWGEWGIMRNEEEVKDTPKPLLPVRVTGGQRAHRQGLDSLTQQVPGECVLPAPSLHSCQHLLIPGPLPPLPPLPPSLSLEVQDPPGFTLPPISWGLLVYDPSLQSHCLRSLLQSSAQGLGSDHREIIRANFVNQQVCCPGLRAVEMLQGKG